LRTVGELLRERREELGLHLDEVGELLRIRPSYLAAIEQSLSHELPGPAYAIGFVRAYANHLGLDADKVLERYRGESTALQARPDLALPVPLGERSLPGLAMLLVAAILALCGYGTWYYLSTGERSRPERVASVPPSLRLPPANSPASSLGPPPATAGTASDTGGTPARPLANLLPGNPSLAGGTPVAMATGLGSTSSGAGSAPPADVVGGSTVAAAAPTSTGSASASSPATAPSGPTPAPGSASQPAGASPPPASRGIEGKQAAVPPMRPEEPSAAPLSLPRALNSVRTETR